MNSLKTGFSKRRVAIEKVKPTASYAVPLRESRDWHSSGGV